MGGLQKYVGGNFVVDRPPLVYIVGHDAVRLKKRTSLPFNTILQKWSRDISAGK